MPENEPAGPSLSKPRPGAPPTQTAKLNYVPFSFEEVPPRLPEKDDYGRFHDAVWRGWCDDLDALKFHALTCNLIDSIVCRGGSDATYLVWFLVEKSLWALQYLAMQREPFAAEHLSRSLARAVQRLNYHATLNPALYEEGARSEITWPVLYAPNKHLVTQPGELQTKLGIGDNYFMKVMSRGKKGRTAAYNFTNAPVNRLALRVIQTLVANKYPLSPAQAEGAYSASHDIPEWVKRCRNLKPFDFKTVNEWAEIGWEAICHMCDGKPEKLTPLKTIGEHRKKRAGVKEARQNMHIRSEIKEELKKALKKMARPHAPIARQPPNSKAT